MSNNLRLVVHQIDLTGCCLLAMESAMTTEYYVREQKPTYLEATIHALGKEVGLRTDNSLMNVEDVTPAHDHHVGVLAGLKKTATAISKVPVRDS